MPPIAASSRRLTAIASMCRHDPSLWRARYSTGIGTPGRCRKYANAARNRARSSGCISSKALRPKRASAACVAPQDLADVRAQELMDIQAIVVPGKAVAVAQGNFDGTRETQRLMYAELVKGTDPEQILEMILRQDPAVGTRQVAMLDV